MVISYLRHRICGGLPANLEGGRGGGFLGGRLSALARLPGYCLSHGPRRLEFAGLWRPLVSCLRGVCLHEMTRLPPKTQRPYYFLSKAYG